LNLLGTAATAGKATHLLKLRANAVGDNDGTNSQEVSIVLYKYDDPIPNVGAFTTGAITAQVGNVAAGSAAVDATVIGRIHQITGTTNFGFEIKIPGSWFASAAGYGGNFEPQGDGASSVVTSLFSSTGAFGSALGTPKDVISDADGNTMAGLTLTSTGGTTQVALIVSKLVITTSTQTITAGTPSTVMTVQTQDEIGPRAVSADRKIDLTSTSTAGTFSTSSDFSSGTVTFVTISNTTNSTNFYYKDTVSGTPTITVAENPSSLGWTDDTQAQTVNPGPLTAVSHTPATSGAEVR
jgi:hypothetical protein